MASRKKIGLGLGAAALVLGTGIGVSGIASAATTPTPPPSASASPDSGHGHDRGHKGGRIGHEGGVRASELAAKLGVDEAKVTDALKSFREANKPSGRPAKGTKPDRAAMEAALAKSLAESLGVDEAKVTAALEELRNEAQSERAAALKSPAGRGRSRRQTHPGRSRRCYQSRRERRDRRRPLGPSHHTSANVQLRPQTRVGLGPQLYVRAFWRVVSKPWCRPARVRPNP
ncbi:DNA-binding MarR family transcriptional regulator [Arthrobacter oryzae]|nr:DNA-binding MarR family transcriptional regulator [Arthrobacter oryzae]